MSIKTTLIAAAAAALLGSMAVPAQADTASTNFNVKITITKACSLASTPPADINLGSYASTADFNTVQGSTSIAVTCSNQTPYTVTLTPTNVTSNTGAGVMKSAAPTNTDTVNYQLTHSTTKTDVWGNTAANQYSGTGTGSAQTLTAYANPTSTLNVAPDTYTDKVTVTLTY